MIRRLSSLIPFSAGDTVVRSERTRGGELVRTRLTVERHDERFCWLTTGERFDRLTGAADPKRRGQYIAIHSPDYEGQGTPPATPAAARSKAL